jgi:hypothetical protein
MPVVILLLSLLILFSTAFCMEEDIEGEEGYMDFVEEMRSVRVDINEATLEELMILPGISPTIASRVTEARKRMGRFSAVEDLLRYGLLSPSLYKEAVPFITVGRKGSSYEGQISVRTRMVGKSSDDGDKRWESGNYTRVKWEHSKKWLAGVMVERDPGESRLLDSWKWAIAYRREKGFLRGFVTGNMRFELSRGLLFFSRSRISKGSRVIISADRRGRGLGIDLSSTEGYYLKGLGMELSPSPTVSVTALVSSSPLDVSRDESGRIISIRISGYHYPSASTDRGGLELSTAATHADIDLGVIGRLGFTMANLRYSEAISPPLDDDNYHDFRGSRRDFAGLDWDLVLGNLGLFGEGVVEIGRGKGVVLGVESGTRVARWNFLFRSYDPDFSPPFGNSFQSGSSNPTNERGFYSGLVFNVNSDLKMSLFFDAYRRLWRRVREPFPVKRGEMFVEGKWRPKRGVWVSLRLIERRGIKVESGEYLSMNRDDITRKLRLQIDWSDRPLTFRGRYERVLSGYGSLSEVGALLYFDTRLRPTVDFSLDMRVLFFGAESTSSTVYAYEVDLPGTMRVVPFAGHGMKWYLYGRYAVRQDLKISIKFGEKARIAEETEGAESGMMYDRSLGIQLDYIG